MQQRKAAEASEELEMSLEEIDVNGLFIVIVFLCLNNEHRYTIIVDVVDNS